VKGEEWRKGRVEVGDGVRSGGGESSKGVVGESRKEGCCSGCYWRGGVVGVGEGEDGMSVGEGKKVMVDWWMKGGGREYREKRRTIG
jgi:hypothetical protein